MQKQPERKVKMSKCGQKTEVYSRVCGYFRPVSNWNRGKKEEFKDRKTYKVGKLTALILLSFVFLTGCASTATITDYDEQGRIIRVAETKNTDFSRVMDGTNAKSQMILCDGLIIDAEVSTSASSTYMPGWKFGWKNGRTMVINQLSNDQANFAGVDQAAEAFFQKVNFTKEGIETATTSQ